MSVERLAIEPDGDHADNEREESDRPELGQNLGGAVALEEDAAVHAANADAKTATALSFVRIAPRLPRQPASREDVVLV